MSKLTLGSLFSGSGGFELGGLLCGIEPLWASEIEPFPIRVTTKRLPNVKHLGDISTINGSEIKPVDIITFGSPCFPANTLILTKRGYIPIEDICVGEYVLTHKGRWRKVTATGSKQSKTIILKGNHYGLETTHEHPIYSAETKNYYPYNKGKRRVIKQLKNIGKWTDAKDMEGLQWATPNEVEYLPIPQPFYYSLKQKKLPEFNEEFFYFVGRWLGDGWVRDDQCKGRPYGQHNGQIFLCDSFDKEQELINTISNITDKYCVFRERTVVKIRFVSTALCEWLVENFGKGAANKTIPAWVFSLPKEYRKSLMQGIEESDGYRVNSYSIKVSTISKRLAFGIRTLAETLGYSSTVYHYERKPTCVIEGRIVNQKSDYTISIIDSSINTNIRHDNHTWYKCRSVTETYKIKTVYNLSVNEDESYIADSIVVHNCTDMSIAGKRAGLDGEQSILFYKAIRIIKEMRNKTNGQYPRYAIWENVPGAFSSNKGEDFKSVLEAIISIKEPNTSVPLPEKGRWPYADIYMGDGWSVAYRTIDAQYFGVPQRRRRIYLVADFAGGCAGKILFESEGMSRNFTPSGSPWQGTARNAEGGTGTSGSSITCLNDQDERVMSFEPGATSRIGGHTDENLSGTLRAHMGDNQTAVVIENHPTDSRIKLSEDNKVQTLTSRMGTGGGNVPLVMNERQYALTVGEDVANTLTGTDYKGTQCVFEPTPKTLKIRSGCEGGNKGALIQDDKSSTLGCNNDQTVFVPFAYGICSDNSNSMKSGNPHSGIYEADTSRTIDANGTNPGCNQGGIAVVALQGSMIGREDKNGPQGSGIDEDISFTLNTVDRHGVVYAIDRETFNCGQNYARNLGITEDSVASTLNAQGPSAVAQPYQNITGTISAGTHPSGFNGQDALNDMLIPMRKNNESSYIVRRLTPTECARLQGFPDYWCDDLGTENPTEDEISFWTDVWETHRKIVSKNNKPKSKNQIIKWLKNPHSDSAEYKMWGNGVALPCVCFVLTGIILSLQTAAD